MTYSNQESGGIDLIFHTNLLSGKAMDLTVHPTEVNMSFLDPISGAWASISGTAHLISSPEIVEKYYSPTLKAWLGDMGDGVHDGGPKDPRIGVIKLEAKIATHVHVRKGIMGRAVDEVKGAVKGDVPSINSIREMSQGELAECKYPSSIFFGCGVDLDISRAPDAQIISSVWSHDLTKFMFVCVIALFP